MIFSVRKELILVALTASVVVMGLGVHHSPLSKTVPMAPPQPDWPRSKESQDSKGYETE